MGTFQVQVTVANLRDPGQSRTVTALVDTGATYTAMPRGVVDDLGCQPVGVRRVLLASGQEQEWPVTALLLTLEGQQVPTICLIGRDGGQALVGAVTLEELALGVDPVAKRLVPVRSYLAIARLTRLTGGALSVANPKPMAPLTGAASRTAPAANAAVTGRA